MIKIHGTFWSRAARVVWAAEELGLTYQHIPTTFTGGSRTPAHLEINPNGHIPVLDDNGLIVWESMAINLYLAEKFGRAPFWPADVGSHAHVYQWSFWGMTETEPHVVAIFAHKALFPPERRSSAAVAAAAEALKAPLEVLDAQLERRPYLLGDEFTIADLNVAAVLWIGAYVKFDVSGTPNVQRWLRRCLERPAFQRASTMDDTPHPTYGGD